MKALLGWARRRPFAALYALGAAGLVLWMAANLVFDAALSAAGLARPVTITLADTGAYTLVNLEPAGENTLVSVTGDAQLLLQPGTLVRRLRLEADYPAQDGGEKDLYWHLPGFGYAPALRVWPAPDENGDLLYALPPFAGQGLRLDLADTAGVEVRVARIVLNEPLAPWRYFVPTGWQLFWLAAAPGLAGCALTLGRNEREAEQ